ncbi:unnamed protein product [Protopolystoma xenopodis]|uniref:Uncharacterized protein n=1 Tax=Protopolystoma xenopodis TaxID=117903 RepID=A0A448WIU8_9PLAT|nr:unnamed protein product [Protopolystoma xenopodis]
MNHLSPTGGIVLPFATNSNLSPSPAIVMATAASSPPGSPVSLDATTSLAKPLLSHQCEPLLSALSSSRLSTSYKIRNKIAIPPSEFSSVIGPPRNFSQSTHSYPDSLVRTDQIPLHAQSSERLRPS